MIRYTTDKSEYSNNVISFCDASQQLSMPQDKIAPTQADVA
jgi:hypothetical protein